MQSLAHCINPLEIHCVDPSLESIQSAKTMWTEMPKHHEINFHRELSELPAVNDVVIVACNSYMRRSIVETLLATKTVKNFVLEKVLFPKLEDYKVVAELITQKGVPTYVNCPRRMYESYQAIKKKIKGKIAFSVYGNNWGLASNTIHFLDLFCYLTGNDQLRLNTAGLDKKILASKREGYFEFSGTIQGSNAKGDCFQISSLQGDDRPLLIIIADEDNLFLIEEGKMVTQHNFADKEIISKMPHIVPYQSDLSHKMVSQILDTGSCALTPFASSADMHVVFIENLITFATRNLGWKENYCPIT